MLQGQLTQNLNNLIRAILQVKISWLASLAWQIFTEMFFPETQKKH